MTWRNSWNIVSWLFSKSWLPCSHVNICKPLLSCLSHVGVLEYKMRIQTGPGTEAFQEISWIQSFGDISYPFSLVMECLFCEDSSKCENQKYRCDPRSNQRKKEPYGMRVVMLTSITLKQNIVTQNAMDWASFRDKENNTSVEPFNQQEKYLWKWRWNKDIPGRTVET